MNNESDSDRPETPNLLEPQEPVRIQEVPQQSRMSTATALFCGLAIGALVVGSMWFYQNHNTYYYKVQRNSSALAKPRDVQEVLAHVEPGTVAITTGGEQQVGAGTGFIYSSDGVVVTNEHVVEGSGNIIKVTLSNGKSYAAKLLGRDQDQDLAVLKIDAEGLPAVKLGSSSEIKVGDDVIAIGNALALEGGLSVTRGIVSGLDRTIATKTDTTLEGIIQTDTAINHGNSGGPLVNSKGEVIGINTAIVNPSFAQNIGFAIAIDRAKPIIEELKEGKGKSIAYLGVSSRDVTDRLANELDLDVKKGALLVQVQPKTPAADGGLEENDVITAIDKNEVTSADSLVEVVQKYKAGDTVTVHFLRDGEKKTVKVTLAERPL